LDKDINSMGNKTKIFLASLPLLFSHESDRVAKFIINHTTAIPEKIDSALTYVPSSNMFYDAYVNYLSDILSYGGDVSFVVVAWFLFLKNIGSRK
jgi:hypothetical protein